MAHPDLPTPRPRAAAPAALHVPTNRGKKLVPRLSAAQPTEKSRLGRKIKPIQGNPTGAGGAFGRNDPEPRKSKRVQRKAPLTAVRATASAAPIAVFALTLGDAGCLWRGRGRFLAHPLVAYAGEEQDLRAVVIGNRTIGPFRGLEADEVVHGGAQD